MGAEYSVNIKLNTGKVRSDLKNIRTDINNLNKAQSKGSKSQLSETEKQLKLENTSLGLKNKALGLEIRALGVSRKGLKIDKIEAKLDDAKAKADKFEFDLAKKSILLAENELKTKQKILEAEKGITKTVTQRFRTGQTGFTAAQFGPQQPMQGPAMGPTSMGLNFDRRTGKLMQGPAGSSVNTFTNLGRRFDLQSALISGGFPLLFGQGPIGAAAGGLGGGVGGMFGQMSGFAGGIAATAAVQAISNTLNSIRDLGNALAKPTENIGLLTEKLGLANTPTGELAAKLEKLGLTSSASALLIDKFTEITGKTPTEIEQITKELNRFNSEMAQFGLKMSIIVSDVFGPFIALINRLPIEKMIKLAVFTKDPLGMTMGNMQNIKDAPASKFVRNRFNKLFPGLFKSGGSSPGSVTTPDKPENALVSSTFETRMLAPLRQAVELEKNKLSMSAERLALKQEEFTLINLEGERDILKNQLKEQESDTLEDQLSLLDLKIQKQQAIIANSKAMLDPARQLSQIIAQDIGSGIKGLIKGTETLNNVLKNVLNKLADAALNMAIFGNVGGQFERGGGGILGSIFKADGGRVRGGSSYIVGERGPELFSPGVSGMITPNNALGGSVNVSVNVDASGTSAEGDEPNAEQLGRLIGAVVQSELIKEKRPGGLLG